MNSDDSLVESSSVDSSVNTALDADDILATPVTNRVLNFNIAARLQSRRHVEVLPNGDVYYAPYQGESGRLIMNLNNTPLRNQGSQNRNTTGCCSIF